ncbi:hypothetical protein DUI87_09505 [Hirundo rustica rustica]|uniref:Uncharacterized protein n=1 Tax=Hirundo rustica rustica TaxID=333673 RepID=A0A3M0KMD9_HIRRU|nr:hypothetical protein DUI87_09505 [Hirundo rustica rustica]
MNLKMLSKDSFGFSDHAMRFCMPCRKPFSWTGIKANVLLVSVPGSQIPLPRSLTLQGSQRNALDSNKLQAGKQQQDKRKWPQAVPGRFQLDIRRNFFVTQLFNSGMTAHGSGRVTTPEGVQEMTGHGTQRYGSVGMVVISQALSLKRASKREVGGRVYSSLAPLPRDTSFASKEPPLMQFDSTKLKAEQESSQVLEETPKRTLVEGCAYSILNSCPKTSATSSALPSPPEEPRGIRNGTPVTGLIPPGFIYANDVKSLGLGQSFKLLGFVPYALCISVETFWVWYVVANTL